MLFFSCFIPLELLDRYCFMTLYTASGWEMILHTTSVEIQESVMKLSIFSSKVIGL